jgi:hypothetical protein
MIDHEMPVTKIYPGLGIWKNTDRTQAGKKTTIRTNGKSGYKIRLYGSCNRTPVLTSQVFTSVSRRLPV